MSAASESQSSPANELLTDIQEIFSRRTRDKIRTTELIEALCDDDEKSWSSYNRGKPITPRQLAKQLDIYGIKPKTVRQPDGKTPKGYDYAQFEDAFARYLKDSTDKAKATPPVTPTSAATPDVAATPQRTLMEKMMDDVLQDEADQLANPTSRFVVADTPPEPPDISDDAPF
jgi:hypothetical protein